MRLLHGIGGICRFMKIAFVYGSLTGGGAERVIANLANRLSENYDVSIIIFSKEESVYKLSDKVKLICSPKIQTGRSMLEKINGFLYRNKFLSENIKKFDCIISFDTFLAVFCKFAGHKIKVIGSERTNPFLTKSLKEKLAIKFSYILDGFVFQTEGASKCYPDAIQEKACIIPNAFWGNNLIMPKYADRENVICASGRITEVKRYDLIVKAFNIVVKKYPEYILKIYGVGDRETEIQEMIEKLQLSKKVLLMGWCKDIISELLKNKIFILASDYEGMPNGLIEAMACGCACVSRDCKFGPDEIIDNENDGILVKTDTENELANALLRVIENETLAEKLSANAHEKIKNEFNEEVMINKFSEYIDAVIKR